MKVRRMYGIEPLERRRLLSATVTSALSNVTVNPNSAPTVVDLSSDFTDPQVTGTAVLIQTSNGDIPIELLGSVAPITVANFLRYVNAGLYNGTIFHRTVANFLDQAGGYKADGTAISSFGSIQNEFHLSNVRGTLAMVKQSGDPNSASNQWFINVSDNSGTLDSQNGGFTVFAQVLYNGMAVADAINALPTVDASQFSSSLPAKPDDPLPVQNANGGVVPSNLVVINSVAVVPAIKLSVTSDDPSLVNAAIGADGHTLDLSYAANQRGVAHITVSATDLGGASVSQSFRVNVGTSGDLLNVEGGKGGAKAVTVEQSNGTSVTVSLKGPGTANVQVLGDSLQRANQKNGSVLVSGANASIFGIGVTGTTVATNLVFAAKGSGAVNVGGITIDGAIGSVNGKAVDLTGNLVCGATIKSIVFHGISNGNVVGGNTAISAVSIKSFTVLGNLSDVSLTLNGSGVGLRSLNVGGALNQVGIICAGSVGSVTAGSIAAGQLLAGIASLAAGQALPTAASQFTTAASIATVKIKSTFSNTSIAAAKLGNLMLGRIMTSNAGTVFGVASHAVGALIGVNVSNGKKLDVHRLSDASTAEALEANLGLVDFMITIV